MFPIALETLSISGHGTSLFQVAHIYFFVLVGLFALEFCFSGQTFHWLTDVIMLANLTQNIKLWINQNYKIHFALNKQLLQSN